MFRKQNHKNGQKIAMSSIVFAHPFPAEKTKTPQSSDYGVFMVDDTRLELVTSRTSSGCATSCANRSFIGIDCSNRCRCICQYFFIIFRRANGILCRRQPAYALYSTFSQRTVTLDAPPTVQVKSVRSQPLEVISSVANGESVSTSATV